MSLTHWGRPTYICVGKLTIIGSDNGLSPGRRQAIIETNFGILLIGSVGINFSEILIEIHTYSFRKMHLNMSSAKWRPFCLGLNVFISVLNSGLWLPANSIASSRYKDRSPRDYKKCHKDHWIWLQLVWLRYLLVYPINPLICARLIIRMRSCNNITSTWYYWMWYPPRYLIIGTLC